MQIIKQNLIKAILGIAVLLVFAAGFYFGSSDSPPIQNIRKLYDNSVSEFEEERAGRNKSLIEKPRSQPSPTNSPSPTPAPSANPTLTPTPTPTPTPISTPTPRFIASPTPSPGGIRRTSSP